MKMPNLLLGVTCLQLVLWGHKTGSSSAQLTNEKMPKHRFTTIPQISIFNYSDIVKKKIQLNRFFRLTHPAFYEPSHLLSG